MINNKELDKIYILQQIKKYSQDQLRDKGIELYISDFYKYDIKNIGQVVKEDNFEKLSDLISGNGIEVDLGEEKEYDKIIEEQENASEKKIIDSSQNRNFINIVLPDIEGNKVDLVFEVTFDKNGAMNVKYAGENLKGGKFIPSEGFEQEIRAELEKVGITKSIDPKVIEREFIPTTVERLNEMNEDGKLDLEDDKEIAQRAIEAQERKNNGIEEELVKQEKDDEEKEGTKEELSEEEKSVVEKACETTGRNPRKIKRVLTIKDPKSATDTLDNDGLNEQGEPITVLEFKGSTGKEEYTLVQGNRVLDKREFDEDINKLVRPISKTQGEVQRVSDEETKVSIKTIDGKEEDVKVQRMPSDLNQSQKAEMIAEISVIIDQMQNVLNDDFLKNEDKIVKIDNLQIALNATFEKYGVIPPSNVRADANEQLTEKKFEEQTGIEDYSEENPKQPWDNYSEGRLRNTNN